MEDVYKTKYLTVSGKKLFVLKLNRAEKANAVCHQLVEDIREFFQKIDLEQTHAVVIHRC